MNPIDTQCIKIRSEQRIGLMAHVVVGYPSLAVTREFVLAMQEEKVDFVELQIPFSDPLGDGPTIRRANVQALKNGIGLVDAFSLAEQLIKKDGIQMPLLFMTYFNIPYCYGLERFCVQSKQSGVSGLIIPDYNLDAESIELFNSCVRKNDQILITFVAPETNPKRMIFLNSRASGFVYCFLAQAVTGVQNKFNPKIGNYLSQVRAHFALPLAVGFGISTPTQIAQLKGYADIVVVGSTLINQFNLGGILAVRSKIKELKAVL